MRRKECKEKIVKGKTMNEWKNFSSSFYVIGCATDSLINKQKKIHNTLNVTKKAGIRQHAVRANYCGPLHVVKVKYYVEKLKVT